MKDIYIVVPTIRESSILRFLDEWKKLFEKYRITLIIVEDNPQKSFNIRLNDYKFKIIHYCWSDIDNDLGKNSWIFPRRSSAIKSFGFYKSYQLGAEMIIALDDDCYPIERYISGFNKKDFIKSHYENLFLKNVNEDKWISTINKIRPRGLPYKNFTKKYTQEKIVLSHGLWANVPDLDGITQLQTVKFPDISEYFKDIKIPSGKYFSMCGMNIAFKREVAPVMYFMLMGKDRNEKKWGFDRFDDIWAGIFYKKISDYLDRVTVSGYPIIWHDRASNPQTNFEKEKTGMKVNEYLWEDVDNISLSGDNFKILYKQLAKKLPHHNNSYLKKLKKAMQIWVDLF